MVIFPNGKINLGLHITGKRPDGYHNIETIFYPIPIKDALEVTRNPFSRHPETQIEFVLTGIEIPGDPGSNLCYKAFELIKKNHPFPEPIRMHIHKAIPAGAGLGGGSSDAAFTLKALNEEMQLQLSNETLKQYALELGSDCPFFIANKPCLAKGRGEILQEIQVKLDNYFFVLVLPNIHISTSWAYSAIQPISSRASLSEIICKPAESWNGHLTNDFEVPVFKKYPELKTIRDELYAAGAAYAALTGSGSCIYGIFKDATTFNQNNISGKHILYHLKKNG